MAAVTLLETTAVAKRFGGLAAVDHVDFSLNQGEIRAIIGPNGAGKTTLVSLIRGRSRPTSGRISFAGEDITRLKSYQRVGRGIVYTFQVTSIFRSLSCYENVAWRPNAASAAACSGPNRRLPSVSRRRSATSTSTTVMS